MASTRCLVEHSTAFGFMRAETEGDRLVRLELGCNPPGSRLVLRKEKAGIGGSYSWAGAGGTLELGLQPQGDLVLVLDAGAGQSERWACAAQLDPEAR